MSNGSTKDALIFLALLIVGLIVAGIVDGPMF